MYFPHSSLDMPRTLTPSSFMHRTKMTGDVRPQSLFWRWARSVRRFYDSRFRREVDRGAGPRRHGMKS
jgi:hypothetical protein